MKETRTNLGGLTCYTDENDEREWNIDQLLNVTCLNGCKQAQREADIRILQT